MNGKGMTPDAYGDHLIAVSVLPGAYEIRSRRRRFDLVLPFSVRLCTCDRPLVFVQQVDGRLREFSVFEFVINKTADDRSFIPIRLDVGKIPQRFQHLSIRYPVSVGKAVCRFVPNVLIEKVHLFPWREIEQIQKGFHRILQPRDFDLIEQERQLSHIVIDALFPSEQTFGRPEFPTALCGRGEWEPSW